MRETIINEIKRLASENGGKPPGRRYFANETGISESDWYGKIWSRWNDAVTEAGFVPNNIAEKHPTEIVLENYAKICRLYGRPPTNPETRLYAREHDDFIGYDAFKRHFGSKAGIIAAARAWAKKNGDVKLLSLLPEPEETKTDSDRIESNERKAEGFVYLLKSGSHFKIGHSDNLERRLNQISVALPEKVKLVHAIRTDDPAGIESYWHRRFADKRANGEWFALNSSDVRVFKRRKFQ